MGTTPTRPLHAVTEVEPRLTFRTIHGYRRAVRIAGSGPAILLVHGIGDNSETWRGIIPHLARNHTVIAPDLLGHGRSDKPRADYSVAGFANGLRDLLAVLDIDRVTVIGHSLGGGVASQFTYQFPELVERLVLVCAGGVSREVHPVLRLGAVPGFALGLRVVQVPGVPAALESTGRQISALCRASGYSRPSVLHDAADGMRVVAGHSDATGHRAFIKTLRAVVDWRGQAVTILDRSYLYEHIPVQIVWGERDGLLPVAHAHLAHSAIPDSRLEIFSESAHFPFHDEPDRFVATVQNFIATTQPAAFDRQRWRHTLESGLRTTDISGSPADRLAVLDAIDATERSAT
ncbi:alpha/beta fold hydrolase [Antrihabitans cavernicola]|uniref:Alpha/beta hydrolase n=1 Tax=Antrihabitans cavernicola TaxID=2495913 RepID=A0A5A7SBS1_9NOCA|nr:alpha/beta hydrolase [Spelaeibacter cavernicola]KAA0023366.1 alpha/beta hydrolase [Spelaeibacter cavernicola]